jgi:hypothetical protein
MDKWENRAGEEITPLTLDPKKAEVDYEQVFKISKRE